MIKKFFSIKTIFVLVVFLGIFAFILPFFISKIQLLNNAIPANSNLANNINGITTPILYLLTSILLFLSFREQYVANQINNKQIEENEKREERRIIIEEILNYESYLLKIGNSTGKFGGNILQDLFCDYINKVNHGNEFLQYRENPETHIKEKHINLYFSLSEFERLFKILSSIKNTELKNEIQQKLYVLFEFYFNGALTINYFHSKFKKELPSDYIENIHKKLLKWRKELGSINS